MRRYSGLFLISHLQSELNRLFQEALRPDPSTLESSDWYPRVDIVETHESIVVLAEAAGMSAEEISITVEGDLVTLEGEKAPTLPGTGGARYQCMERGRGRFERSVRIPQPVNSHLGTATMAAGLLRIEFPKISDQRKRSHRISIELVEESE